MTTTTVRPNTAGQHSIQNAQQITVGIADDHLQFCKALSQTIAAHPEFKIVFTAHDGNHLVKEAVKHKPQVVLTDIQMPFVDGIEASKLMKELVPETAVIALSMHCDNDHVWQMYQAGARGYLKKSSPPDQIVEAIRQVHNCGVYWCASLSQSLQQMVNQQLSELRQTPGTSKETFSEVEIKVMRLICEQKCCRQIASALKVKERTLNDVYERLRKKTDSVTHVGIVVYAVRHGFWRWANSLLCAVGLNQVL